MRTATLAAAVLALCAAAFTPLPDSLRIVADLAAWALALAALLLDRQPTPRAACYRAMDRAVRR